MSPFPLPRGDFLEASWYVSQALDSAFIHARFVSFSFLFLGFLCVFLFLSLHKWNPIVFCLFFVLRVFVFFFLLFVFT